MPLKKFVLGHDLRIVVKPMLRDLEYSSTMSWFLQGWLFNIDLCIAVKFHDSKWARRILQKCNSCGQHSSCQNKRKPGTLIILRCSRSSEKNAYTLSDNYNLKFVCIWKAEITFQIVPHLATAAFLPRSTCRFLHQACFLRRLNAYTLKWN